MTILNIQKMIRGHSEYLGCFKMGTRQSWISKRAGKRCSSRENGMSHEFTETKGFGAGVGGGRVESSRKYN